MAALACLAMPALHAQETAADSASKELSELVISASKFPEKKLNIAQRIDVISSKYISRVNAQNTGDLLMNTGNVFVQQLLQQIPLFVTRKFLHLRIRIFYNCINAVYTCHKRISSAECWIIFWIVFTHPHISKIAEGVRLQPCKFFPAKIYICMN